MNDLLKHADRIPVTLVIVIAYVTLFVLTQGATDKESWELLIQYGLLRPFDVIDGESWRMLAAAFLHAGIVHLGMNTLALIALGPQLEMSIGSLRFAALYVVSALTGHIAVCLVYDVRMGVLGGSGALFGMLGAILALNMRAGRHPFQFFEHAGGRRFVGMIAIYLALPLVFPMIPISNSAHIGGLLGGFFLTFLWLQPGRAPTALLHKWRLALTALFAVLLVWCWVPAPRWDWLWLRSLETTGEQRDALRRAATMSYKDVPSVVDAQTHGLNGTGERVRERR